MFYVDFFALESSENNIHNRNNQVSCYLEHAI